ncbi:MAG: glucose-1-phosphate cytidylyltransferase [Deltaproteobacteria bacterium]|nr:glucose-1-phosphate cytidylyltransferase [Deltaproteobacteria bacterium]
MKVVLFCGGLGTRLGGLTEDLPKPLVKIGYRPILWHLMKYYAHFGYKDFILCLGYRADKIKNYFLNYDECLSNDFTMTNGGKDIQLNNHDIDDWRITFVDTGLKANIGQRLRAVEKYLDGEEMFLANYSDGLTDLPLAEYIDFFQRSGKIAGFVCVKPSQSFHVVQLNGDQRVQAINYVKDTDILINGGYFVFRRQIFDYLRPGEELVEEPFRRLIADEQLVGYRYDRFWCMDTFKEHQELTDMVQQDNAPWEVWKSGNGRANGAGRSPC